MFQINARKLASILSEFRRVLGVNKRSSIQLVTFATTSNCLTIKAQSESTIVAYETSCASRVGEFTARLSDLHCFGQARGAIEFTVASGEFIAKWQNGAKTISRSFDQHSKPDYPSGQIVLYSNRTELATTLLHAAGLTDPESKRYALGCIRLRSSDGQVAGTDGLRAYVQTGFSLPAGELLVPAAAIRKFGALSKANAISVGLRDDWVGLRVGTITARWSLDIKRQTTGRFPDVDRCIPRLADSRARLVLSESDAAFLTDQLSRLSPDRYEQGPVTLEVARLPVIRIRLREREYNRLFTQQHVTERSTQQSCGQDSAYRVLEIQLDSSAGSGAEMRCAVDHLHILALLRMGFRQLDFECPGSPVYAIDGTRAYVCSVSGSVTVPAQCDHRVTSSDQAYVA